MQLEGFSMSKAKRVNSKSSPSKKSINTSTDEATFEEQDFVVANNVLADLDRVITLGRLMRSLRLCEELTVTAMAEKLGVSKQFLSAVENDRKQIGIEFIAAFAKILGTPSEPLLEIYFRDTLRKHGLNLQVKLSAAS